MAGLPQNRPLSTSNAQAGLMLGIQDCPGGDVGP